MQIYIDLTHEIFDGMPVFPGDLPLSLNRTHNIVSDGYSNFMLNMGMHTGTHLDSPAHFYDKVPDIADIDINRLCGNGIILDARNRNEIDLNILEDTDIPKESIVVICTGHYIKYGQDSYFKDYPVLNKDICKYFIERNKKMVCLDTPSPDKFPYEIHLLLLEAGILIAENLTNTEALLLFKNFNMFVMPLKIRADGSPARIFAQYESKPVFVT